MTIDPFELEKPYREAVGAFEMLRRCGFRSSDIYFGVTPALGPGEAPPADGSPPPPQIFVTLKTQGKTFTLTCGVCDGTPEHVEAIWTELAAGIVDGSVEQALLDRTVVESVAFLERFDLITALTERGFMLPAATPAAKRPS